MHNDRKAARKTLRYPGWIAIEGMPMRQCFIEDASDGGAKLIVEDVESVPTLFKLRLSPTARTHRDCEVRWRQPGAIGVRYLRGGISRRRTEVCEVIL